MLFGARDDKNPGKNSEPKKKKHETTIRCRGERNMWNAGEKLKSNLWEAEM